MDHRKSARIYSASAHAIMRERAEMARKRAEVWGDHLPQHLAVERREAVLRWVWIALLVGCLVLGLGYIAAQTVQ
ncbi:MAG: hypothetical protein EOO77_38625 [Oxalobacteraceae bacterium]|nr:MAG: hypothetical protein EOO77_38625 [Oxalobacteraceae bacterium]